MIGTIRALVRQRAVDRCEYCHLRQEENLCLACIDCNLHKGPNLTGIDPDTGAVTELFHPRRQSWEDHFAWKGILLSGKTAVGRTTVRVLEMNSEAQLELRSLI